jgi:hypothetical protein
VIAENVPHCPRCMAKTKTGGDCYDAEKEDAGAEIARVPFDTAFASLNYALYKKSLFDIVGVFTMSRFAKRSYTEGVIDPRLFLSDEVPKFESLYHPVWNVVKMSGLLQLVSGSFPITSTRTYSKASNEFVFTSSSSLGRKEEILLPYKLLEPYFQSLSVLIGDGERDIDDFYSILETSDTYRQMFALKYSVLRSSPLYKTLSTSIVFLAKNDKPVASALSKVHYFCFLTYLANPEANTR